jgi:hypothetical protein
MNRKNLSKTYAVNAQSGRLTKSENNFYTGLQLLSGGASPLNEEIMEDAVSAIAQSEGALLCPDVSANYMGLVKLIEKDWVNTEAAV